MTSIAENRFQLNAMRIQNALKRAKNEQGHLITTGEVRKGFEWILNDDSVICCEFIRGTTLEVRMDEGEIISVGSRNVEAISLFDTKPLWISGIDAAKSRGMFDKYKPDYMVEIIGIIPELNVVDLATVIEHGVPMFYPIEHCVKRMKYGQWGKHPKTLENISNWLKEDLGSNLPEYLRPNIGAGIASHSLKYRPWGLLFVNDEGRFAKITCESFPWFYEERLNRKPKKSKRNRTSKEDWEKMSDAEKEKHRTEARSKRHSR